MDKKIITPREFHDYVEQQMAARGWNSNVRDTVKHVFSEALEDAEYGERPTIFHGVQKGINEVEMKRRMAELRDPHSSVSKNIKYPLHNDRPKLDELEKILDEALQGNKEKTHWF